ncbi:MULTISPECIES: hypothetical protein [Burkholderia]|uniref:hypothetical protein n=1 Tax=Burkholderia TaxID=32008 RepID=UPI001581DD8C|nr:MULTISPECIES: hypothetical protein [Burkholderia]
MLATRRRCHENLTIEIILDDERDYDQPHRKKVTAALTSVAERVPGASIAGMLLGSNVDQASSGIDDLRIVQRGKDRLELRERTRAPSRYLMLGFLRHIGMNRMTNRPIHRPPRGRGLECRQSDPCPGSATKTAVLAVSRPHIGRSRSIRALPTFAYTIARGVSQIS